MTTHDERHDERDDAVTEVPERPGEASEPEGTLHELTEPGLSMPRRAALKVIAASAGAVAALPALGCAPGDETPEAGGTAGAAPQTGTTGGPAIRGAPEGPAGTLTDPDLLNPIKPWSGTLSEEEMRTTAALCDVIIPEDERSPSASAVGAHEFIDEWVSAPYEANRNDRVLIRGGLVWLNVEATKRFGREFVELSPEEQHAICDDIHYLPEAAPEFQAGARFFDRMRDLTATAFYTTEEGMADLQYIGNVAMAEFEGPPPEVLERLGITPDELG